MNPNQIENGKLTNIFENDIRYHQDTNPTSKRTLINARRRIARCVKKINAKKKKSCT